MNRLFVYGLIVFGVYYMLKGGMGIADDIRNVDATVVLSNLTEGQLNEKIVAHYKTTVLGGVGEFYADAIETTISDLNDDGKKDVIAIVESSATCSGGGCVASIFLENALGELIAIPFSTAVRHIEVLDSVTEGMHDLKVNHDESYRMIWDGTTYVREEI